MARNPKKPKKKRTKSQVGKMSKRKGDNFERHLATNLQKAYGIPGTKKGDREFYRTPLSGGMKTEFSGDIVVPDWFPFMIEAKNREEIGDLSTLYTRRSAHPLVKWIKEEARKAKKMEKALLVVFKRNFGPILVAIQGPQPSSCPHVMMKVSVGAEEFVIFEWKDFLKMKKDDLLAYGTTIQTQALVREKRIGPVVPLKPLPPKSES